MATTMVAGYRWRMLITGLNAELPDAKPAFFAVLHCMGVP